MKTLSLLESEYLQARQNRLAYNTQQLTKRAFRYLMKFCEGDLRLDCFTEDTVENFQNYLIDTYSKTTANMYIKSLRSVFRWAMRKKWIKDDVFGVSLAKPTEYAMRIYAPSEMQAITEYLYNEWIKHDDERSLFWLARILLARTAGLRRSEALNLQISDVDYEKMVIQIQPKTDAIDSWAWQPKGRKPRTVALTEDTANVLTEIQGELLVTGQPYLTLPLSRYCDVLALKRKGRLTERIRLCPDENFNTPFKRILKRAQVAPGTYHDLRKTCLTDLADKGYPIHRLQKFAGHSSHTTTMRYYIHVDEQKSLEQARQLIGATRFERAAFAPPVQRSCQIELRPVNETMTGVITH